MQTAEDRIRGLARSLRPVRPIPPLRAVVAAGACLWLAVFLALQWLGDTPPRPWDHPDWSDPGFLAILVGLGLVAIGSTLGALASSVPGREATTRAGLACAILGGIVAITSGVLSTSVAELRFDARELIACFSCIGHSTVLGISSALASCAFIAYAVLRRPGTSTALAIIGGVAFGAIIVHASCEAASGFHRLVSHVLAPLFAAAVLTLPVTLATRLLANRFRRD